MLARSRKDITVVLDSVARLQCKSYVCLPEVHDLRLFGASPFVPLFLAQVGQWLPTVSLISPVVLQLTPDTSTLHVQTFKST